MKEIIFTFTDFSISANYKPEPAMSHIPEWYKKQSSYINNKKAPIGDGNVDSTIKKCMPVFDAMTSGYLLFTHSDLYIHPTEDGPYFQWASPILDFHPVDQAPLHPKNNNYPYPKFLNPWSIKTPPGYSCLFINPLHRSNVFSILEGIVDTDIYSLPVNLPFTLNDPNFEGYIPAGTPMAQIIPVKRDEWQMQIGNNTEEINKQHRKLSSVFFNRYKQMFWSKKSYK